MKKSFFKLKYNLDIGLHMQPSSPETLKLLNRGMLRVLARHSAKTWHNSRVAGRENVPPTQQKWGPKKRVAHVFQRFTGTFFFLFVFFFPYLCTINLTNSESENSSKGNDTELTEKLAVKRACASSERTDWIIAVCYSNIGVLQHTRSFC